MSPDEAAHIDTHLRLGVHVQRRNYVPCWVPSLDLSFTGEVLAEQLLPYDGGHRTLGSLYEAPMETQETEDTLDTCLESLPPQNHEIQDEEASKAEYKDRKKRKCSDEKKDHCAGLSNKQLFPFLVKTETLEKPQDLLLEYTREKVVLIVSDSEDDNREHVKPETPPPDVPTSTWGGPSSDDRVRNGSTLGADDADGVLGEISKPYQEAEGTYEVDEVVMLLDNRYGDYGTWSIKVLICGTEKFTKPISRHWRNEWLRRVLCARRAPLLS